jgi:hypothetical protein
MQLPVTRGLRRRNSDDLGPWALLGFGAGLAAGFVLGEVFGTSGRKRVGRLLGTLARRRSTPETRSALATRIAAVLKADAALSSHSFEILPIGRSGLELHGWVTSRAFRSRAHRLAQTAAGTEPIVNRLLVWGEDDGPPPLALDNTPRSA